MTSYYVDKRINENGFNEVHRFDCKNLPILENRMFVGEFDNCSYAVSKAKLLFPKAKACTTCSPECHKR